jgi:hypothetical protein
MSAMCQSATSRPLYFDHPVGAAIERDRRTVVSDLARSAGRHTIEARSSESSTWSLKAVQAWDPRIYNSYRRGKNCLRNSLLFNDYNSAIQI